MVRALVGNPPSSAYCVDACDSVAEVAQSRHVWFCKFRIHPGTGGLLRQPIGLAL